jgi:high affinity choline transporter 7
MAYCKYHVARYQVKFIRSPIVGNCPYSLLSADLVYVLLFPQLLLILYWNEYCNSYGCIASFLTGFLFRILGKKLFFNIVQYLVMTFDVLCAGGEPLIGLPAILAYPFYDRNLGQLFPFRTMSMIISLMSHVIVSLSSRWIFLNNWLPPSWDLLQCFDCPVNCTAVGSIHQSVTVATISQLSDPRRKSHDGSINAQHQNLDMGRMYIPRPKLRRNSAHGIYRRPDSLSTSSQREPRNQ